MTAVKGQTLKRGRPASNAELNRMINAGMTFAQIGAALGISDTAARDRLRHRGMVKPTSPKKRRFDPAEAVRLYAAGVIISEIAAATGMSEALVRRRARDAGLPPRNNRTRHQSITLNDYRQAQLATAMAATARIEQEQMRLAEMVDRKRYPDRRVA